MVQINDVPLVKVDMEILGCDAFMVPCLERQYLHLANVYGPRVSKGHLDFSNPFKVSKLCGVGSGQAR